MTVFSLNIFLNLGKIVIFFIKNIVLGGFAMFKSMIFKFAF